MSDDNKTDKAVVVAAMTLAGLGLAYLIYRMVPRKPGEVIDFVEWKKQHGYGD